jgi:hypothetical protein
VGRDAVGFMTLPAEPSEKARIVLRFENISEPKRAAALSGTAGLLTLILLAAGVWRRKGW